ncbi:MAG: alpha/beta hydrolase family protein [Candidatus Binataceae bacterium]
MSEQQSKQLAFMYFPQDYRWSIGMLLALGAAPWGGAEIDEVHRVGLSLGDHVGDDAQWFAQWAKMGEKVERRGRQSRHNRTIAACLMRAANYYHIGERFLQPKSADGMAIFRRGVECFQEAAKLISRPKIEAVEVPYEGKSLPGLLVHAESAGRRAPAMVFFDGFDITKEIQYFRGVPELAARGIACLIVDGPGNGESIRFRGLTLHHETERYGRAAYEYLAGRPEFDPARIGIMAISLGGYYAPRAAAFERRFACCVAWGAQWDYHATWKDRLERLAKQESVALPVAADHLMWIFGVRTPEEAMKRLEGFRLDGVAQKIQCPFLLVHGERDAQIPLEFAEKLYNAVGSEEKTLRVFTPDEGGFHHCQIDNSTIAVEYIADWLEEVLEPGR